MASEEFWAGREFFTPEEFDHPEDMDEGFIALLEVARREAGIPFVVTSDYRPGDKKCHGKGKAVDLRCKHSSDRFTIVRALIMVGFVRIGIYLHEEDGSGGHIHVDWCSEEDGFPQGSMWTGRSR